jgi:hypothetical protein
MSTADVESNERFLAGLNTETYNKVGGTSFALWGLMHVIFGAVGVGIFFTGGTASMLAFVDLDAAVNPEAARMSALIVQFYQALLLVGLTSLVIGITLNWRGQSLGLALNAVLVANIEAAFIWFEVIPGHRPVAIGVVSVLLLVLGVICCGLGSLR